MIFFKGYIEQKISLLRYRYHFLVSGQVNPILAIVKSSLSTHKPRIE